MKIGKGVRIKESIVLEGAIIDPFATVLMSIIGWRSKIGTWSRIEGTAPQEWVNAKVSGDPKQSSNGLKDQSVTILGEDVCISSETCIRNCTVLPHKSLRGSYTNDILM